MRVDADDFVNANFLLFLCTYLESNHDAFGVACDYILVDEHENIIGPLYRYRMHKDNKTKRHDEVAVFQWELERRKSGHGRKTDAARRGR